MIQIKFYLTYDSGVIKIIMKTIQAKRIKELVNMYNAFILNYTIKLFLIFIIFYICGFIILIIPLSFVY